MNEIEIKKEQIAKWAKGGTSVLLLGAVALLFSIIIAAVGSIVVAAGAALFFGILIVQLIPWWSMYCANLATSLMFKQAQDNPIETLVNIAGEMQREVDDYKKLTGEQIAMVDGIEAQVNELRRTDPEGAAQSDEDIRLYREEIAQREEVLGQAVADLEKMKDKINIMKGRWKVAQLHKDYQKKNPKGKAAFMRAQLVDESYTSIQTAAARSRAELRMNSIENAAKKKHLADKNAPKQEALQNNPTNVIDVSSVLIKEKVQ